MPKRAGARTALARKAAKNPLYTWIAAILLLAAAIAAITVFGLGAAKPKTTSQASCGFYRDDKTVTINGHAFKAEAPNSQAGFDKGLGGRPCILPDEAMIFPFSTPGQYTFWMKGMKFPIDMVWINVNHQVVQDFIDVQPSTYPSKTFANPQRLPAEYVLEIKANLSKQLKIGLGTIAYF